MTATGRALALLGLLAALPLLVPGAGPALAALDLLLLAAALREWRSLPAPGALGLRRLVGGNLSVGRRNSVTLVVTNPTDRPLTVAAADDLPEGLEPDPAEVSGTVAPGGELRLSYTVLPARRGDFGLGTVSLAYGRPGGLVRRVAQVDLPRTLRVTPDLHAVRRLARVARRALQPEEGSRRTALRGGAAEFARLRDWVPGDDVRHVSWSATARRGRPVVREYEPQRSQQVTLLLDTARLMSFRAGLLTKLDHAANAAVCLAWVAAARGDAVGLLAYADDVRALVAPRKGRAALPALVDALYGLQPEPVEADPARAVAALAARARRRSLVVVLTDVVDETTAEPLRRNLAWLQRRHLVLLLALGDRASLASAERDPADEDGFWLDAATATVRAARAHALARLRRLGVTVVDATPATLSRDAVAAYLELKERGRW